MCGIVGYSSKENYNKEIIQFLLYFNSSERTSVDGTGFWNPEQGVIKSDKSCKDFLKTQEIKLSHEFIGHVRSKSVGMKSDKNAHPFQYDQIIGCQNGTLKNHWAMCSKYKLTMADYDTDAQIFFKALSTVSDFKTLSEIDGPSAFLWKNTKTNLMYVFRNSGRELYRGKLDKGMYISSEKTALEIIGCGNIQEFKEDSVYRILNGEILQNVIKIKNTPITYTSHYESRERAYPEPLHNTYGYARPYAKYTGYVDWFHVDAKDLAGSLLYYTGPNLISSIFKNTDVLTKNTWYRVGYTPVYGEAYDKVNVVLPHPQTELMPTTKRNFDINSLPGNLKYVEALRDLKYAQSGFNKKEGELCIIKGEVLKILKMEAEAMRFEVYSNRGSETIFVAAENLKPATFSQFQKYQFSYLEDSSNEEQINEDQMSEDILTLVNEYLTRIKDSLETFEVDQTKVLIDELETELAQCRAKLNT